MQVGNNGEENNLPTDSRIIQKGNTTHRQKFMEHSGPSIEQCKQLTAGGCVRDGRRSRRPSERKNASKETNISGFYCRNFITWKNCQLF